MLGYEDIKQLAKTHHLPVTELLALSPKNDPFYAGTPAAIRDGEWFARIWNRAGYDVTGAHLRKVHYWTLSHAEDDFTRLPPSDDYPQGRPYQNTQLCWGYLTQASKMARYLGLVDIEKVDDNKNPAPLVEALYSSYDYVYHSVDLPELEGDLKVRLYGAGNSMAQPYHMEVWVEKSTMNSVLGPICQEYSTNLVTFEGEASITACLKLVQRVQEAQFKPTRIFYVSDLDPAGNSMPVATARKIEYLLRRYGYNDVDLELTPIALNVRQVEEYNLPSVPIKDSESRAGNFQSVYDGGAVELDALEALYPGELGNIVREALEMYYSEGAEAHSRQVLRNRQQAVRDAVEDLKTLHPDEFEAAKTFVERIRGIEDELDPADFIVDQFEADVEKSGDALFDSTRRYVDQIPFYKAHKGKESVLA